MLSGVIFDLDGTLGDTLPVCFAAFRTVFEEYLGESPADAEIRAMFGPTEEGILRARIPDGSGVLDRYLEAYADAHSLAPKPFAGVEPLLSDLEARAVPVAVVTGKGPHSAMLSLVHWGLDTRFPIVKAGGDDGNIKDRNMAEVVAEWRVFAADVVSVGDAPSDVTAAHTVGIVSVAAAWASTAHVGELSAAQPDHLFGGVSEFAEWLLDR